MKRMMGIVGASALLFAGAAQVSAASPNDDFGPIPPCADARKAVGVYDPVTDALTFDVHLLGTSTACVGSIAVDYELWVIKDRPPENPLIVDANHFNVPAGVTSAPELVASAATSVSADGKVLTYLATVADDDATICLFSRHAGTVTTTTTSTTTTTDEGDHNNNGNTNDDKHKNNEGNNKAGDKHDWETTTTTTTTTTIEEFLDRAPNVTNSDGVTDESSCFPVNTAWDSRPGDVPARGYN